MADEQTHIPTQSEELASQLIGIVFEHILPWGSAGGDTGLSSRLKLKRNFEKIRAWIDAAYEMFLSRLYDDNAKGRITFDRGLTTYNDEQRYMPSLLAKGDAVFEENLSSPDFISGVPGGIGWALQKKEFVNSAGVTEYKYILECDGANIRNTLRVYEFIISQLLGENDNRIFTAMAEVHHYDPETGKVWLKTNCGKLYMPFRVNDCIMVQQYQPGNDAASGGDGYITKSYELRITEVGSGGEVDENGDRLDWVKFTAFATTMENGTPAALIEQHDTFCRVDNLTDPERKGIIQLTSVGTNAPYMDIIYGLKTDPDNHLKGRLGNLQGIYHHLFGWLQEFGEYLINAYIVGDVRLRRTGESLDTAVQILQGLVAAKIAETVYEVTDDENYLRNASFMELNLDGSVRDWTFEHVDIMFYTLDGEAVISSVGTLADVRRGVKTETVEGSQVLHIINSSISQSHLVMKQPGTHKVYDEGSGSSQTTSYQNVRDSLYLNMRIRVINPGTLRVGFPDSQLSDNRAFNTKVRVLERSNEWLTLQWEGTWDGESDFVLTFDGECYITALSLTDEPLSEFKTEFSTQFNQTSRNISLIATRTSSNETNIAQLSITATQIQQTVSSNYTALDGRISSNTSAITQTAQSIRQEVSSVAGTASDLSTRVGSLEVTAGNVSARVSAIEGDYVKSASLDLVVRKDASGHLESGVYVSADYIDFTFTHTANFNSGGVTVMSIDSYGNLWIAGQYQNGLKIGNNGIERWNDSKEEWGELYASRCARFLSKATEYLNKDDDFLISVWPNTRIYLPSGCADGKVISIKTIGHTTNIQPPSGQSLFTDHIITSSDNGMDLNGYDRAEFVLYNGSWYWNFMSI